MPLQRKLPTLKGLWESVCSEVTTQLTLNMGFLRLQGAQYSQLRVGDAETNGHFFSPALGTTVLSQTPTGLAVV